MRKVKLALYAGALLFTGIVAANETVEYYPTKSISEQLESILADNVLDVEKQDAIARVLFKLNAEGEIEILEVASERKDVEWFLNRKLDGKKIIADKTSIGEVFVVDVRVTS